MWEIKSWCSRRVTTLTQWQNLGKKKEAYICKRNSLTFWEAEYQSARNHLELDVERKENSTLSRFRRCSFPLYLQIGWEDVQHTDYWISGLSSLVWAKTWNGGHTCIKVPTVSCLTANKANYTEMNSFQSSIPAVLWSNSDLISVFPKMSTCFLKGLAKLKPHVMFHFSFSV